MRAHANAHSKGYPVARSVTPSPRMIWQHIDLCEPDNMLADNVALELLLPQHDQLATTERICGKWVHMGVRAASDKKGYNSDNEKNDNK